MGKCLKSKPHGPYFTGTAPVLERSYTTFVVPSRMTFKLTQPKLFELNERLSSEDNSTPSQGQGPAHCGVRDTA